MAYEAYERKAEKENINLNEVIDEMLPELFERVNVSKEEQAIAEILTQNLGRIPLECLKKAWANHRELYRLQGNYLVPEKVMETEQYAIDAVEREKGLYQPLKERFVPFNGSGKRKAQSEVIQGILWSRDHFTLRRDVADSGKILTLKELVWGLKGNPLLLVTTNSAVEVLKQGGFSDSQTVASFLLNPPQFNGLLIVDESGLNSLRDGVALLNLAENR